MIFDYTFWMVLFSCSVLAAASSMVGVVSVLQKESLLGDALSHAALPGVVIAFLLAQTKVTLFLLLGAFGSGAVAVAIIYLVKEYTTLPFDGILATVLSSFFGLGMVLLTLSQKMPNAAQAGLKNFIFGQASAIIQEDAILISVVSLVIAILFVLFWKEIKVFVFDPLFAKTSGINTVILKWLLGLMMTIIIIVELQTVGIILTSSMLIAPGVAAMQWVRSFAKTVLLAMCFGVVAAVIGTTSSSLLGNVPTGPTIVVTISLITVVSIFCGTYGVLPQKLRQRKMMQGE